jgi:hypothetical protein
VVRLATPTVCDDEAMRNTRNRESAVALSDAKPVPTFSREMSRNGLSHGYAALRPRRSSARTAFCAPKFVGWGGAMVLRARCRPSPMPSPGRSWQLIVLNRVDHRVSISRSPG